MRVPGHVGIWRNEAAKEVLDEKAMAELMPFLDLKSLTAKFILYIYIYQIWYKEWDKLIFSTLTNVFRRVLPKLSDGLLSFL